MSLNSFITRLQSASCQTPASTEMTRVVQPGGWVATYMWDRDHLRWPKIAFCSFLGLHR